MTSPTTDSTRTLFVSNRSGGDGLVRGGVPCTSRGPVCAASAAATQVPKEGGYFPQTMLEQGRDKGDSSHIVDARPILPLAAFFLGDLRDGLPMVRIRCSSTTDS